MTFLERCSNPLLGFRKFVSGFGFRDSRTGGHVRRGSGGGGAFTKSLPEFVLRSRCKSPLSSDCSTLQVTPQWAVGCFKPTYHQLRKAHGKVFHRLVTDLISREIPGCATGDTRTGAEQELHRRIQFAVAALMNSEGVPVEYPQAASFPRPARAQEISQPWLRVLLTGHL